MNRFDDRINEIMQTCLENNKESLTDRTKRPSGEGWYWCSVDKKWKKDTGGVDKGGINEGEYHPSRRPVPNVSDKEGEEAIKAVKGQLATPKPTSIPKELPNPPHVSDEEGEAAIKAIKGKYRKK